MSLVQLQRRQAARGAIRPLYRIQYSLIVPWHFEQRRYLAFESPQFENNEAHCRNRLCASNRPKNHLPNNRCHLIFRMLLQKKRILYAQMSYILVA